ncbi:hypothetical protein DXA44_03485 [Coprobacillus sp. OF02-11LB]|nr:hypothetical protein DXA44_03485 [Coprobacillus sp. OF02-11LB]RGH27378.1 hypothetical protein DWV15_09340 [Coprobacillus sp. AF02-13]
MKNEIFQRIGDTITFNIIINNINTIKFI